MSSVVGNISDFGNALGFYNPGGSAGKSIMGTIAGPTPQLPPPPPPIPAPAPVPKLKKPQGAPGATFPMGSFGGTLLTGGQGVTSPALTGGKTLLGQ